jgi:hypothetical protein
MITRYNNISLAIGAPGFILQVVGNFMISSSARDQRLLGAGIILLGTVLWFVGLAYYAIAKGRHPAWCLLAFLSLIGLIVLAC